ncbi:MAG TPA: hypothetical protein VGY53_00285, partial [Isosphaeraceae bacterium]|nr:hypothetical protein [Isosphaeraceae bacterium]
RDHSDGTDQSASGENGALDDSGETLRRKVPWQVRIAVRSWFPSAFCAGGSSFHSKSGPARLWEL